MILLDKNGDEIRVGDVVNTDSYSEGPKKIPYATRVLALAGESVIIEDYIQHMTRLVFAKDCVLDQHCKGK